MAVVREVYPSTYRRRCAPRTHVNGVYAIDRNVLLPKQKLCNLSENDKETIKMVLLYTLSQCLLLQGRKYTMTSKLREIKKGFKVVLLKKKFLRLIESILKTK